MLMDVSPKLFVGYILWSKSQVIIHILFLFSWLTMCTPWHAFVYGATSLLERNVITVYVVTKWGKNANNKAYNSIYKIKEEPEDTKGSTRVPHKSKDRQHNGKEKMDDLQNTTQKTKDRATRTPLKTGSERRCSWKNKQCLSTRGTSCVTPVYIIYSCVYALSHNLHSLYCIAVNV